MFITLNIMEKRVLMVYPSSFVPITIARTLRLLRGDIKTQVLATETIHNFLRIVATFFNEM